MAENVKTRPGQRDPIDELIKHELTKSFEIVNALQYLEIINKNYVPDSTAWLWFESNPPREEKLRVLEYLNYNISMF